MMPHLSQCLRSDFVVPFGPSVIQIADPHRALEAKRGRDDRAQTRRPHHPALYQGLASAKPKPVHPFFKERSPRQSRDQTHRWEGYDGLQRSLQ